MPALTCLPTPKHKPRKRALPLDPRTERGYADCGAVSLASRPMLNRGPHREREPVRRVRTAAEYRALEKRLKLSWWLHERAQSHSICLLAPMFVEDALPCVRGLKSYWRMRGVAI